MKQYTGTAGQENAQNGIAECHEEQIVHQRMSAMLKTIFSARKELTVLFKQCDCSI